ncbi:hypothetical protein HOL52_03415 [bacterium]|jgi:membrane protein DedA with SNARE-associated domain|nr:hypothetical protein [bacterium]
MEKIIDYIQNFSEIFSLEWFVFLGGIVEEVIAPIPSPVIMTFAGSTLSAMDVGYWYLILIGVLGAIGKTIGSLVLYFIGFKLEDIFIHKYGNYFGLSEKLFLTYSEKINNLRYGVFWISVLRSLPFVPSAPFSGIFGILKYDIRKFLIGTMIGNIIRDTFYVLIGYYSLKNLDYILDGFFGLDKVFTLLAIAFCFALLYKLRSFYIKKHS